jgi:hypothetical protein
MELIKADAECRDTAHRKPLVVLLDGSLSLGNLALKLFKPWSLAEAEAILALRSLKKSHDNDLRDYWRFRARQVRVRLYGGKPKYGPMPRLRRVA